MCVGLDSESKSDEENIANNGDHEDHGNDISEDNQTVTLVITSTMATMMTQTMETATTMVKMMLVQVFLHLKLFIVLRRMMVAMRLKKLTQVQVVLEVITAPNPMVTNEEEYIYIILWVKPADSILRCQHHAIDTNILFQQ